MAFFGFQFLDTLGRVEHPSIFTGQFFFFTGISDNVINSAYQGHVSFVFPLYAPIPHLAKHVPRVTSQDARGFFGVGEGGHKSKASISSAIFAREDSSFGNR